MEPQNRPYVDPSMEPGDTGTEPWADEPANAESDDRGPLADGGADRDAEGALAGSPADAFDDGDAIADRSDEAV
jgi:hypothetical protein